ETDLLFELQGTLRKTEEVAVDDGLAGIRFVDARAERDEERYEVIDRRMRVWQSRRAAFVLEERVDVALGERLRSPRVELLRPRGRGRVGTEVANERKAVRHETRADDEHALIAQWRELLPDLEQLARVQARHADLQYRDVGLRVHHEERRMRAVTEIEGRNASTHLTSNARWAARIPARAISARR